MKHKNNTLRILFVCHGNICRSPMAEFIMKSLVSNRTDILIESVATSDEEIGNPIYPPTQKKMKEKGIIFDKNKKARRMSINDYHQFDFIVAMDKLNLRNILHIIGNDTDHKISLLMDYTSNPREIADPWYTGDYETTYNDIKDGCEGLLKYLIENERL